MRKQIKKVLAGTLVLGLMSSSLSGCAAKSETVETTTTEEALIENDEYEITLVDASLEKGEDGITFDVKSDEDVFNDSINAEHIIIKGIKYTYSGEGEEGNFDKKIIDTNIKKVSFNSAKDIKVEIDDIEECDSFVIDIDRTATLENNFAEAVIYIDENESEIIDSGVESDSDASEAELSAYIDYSSLKLENSILYINVVSSEDETVMVSMPVASDNLDEAIAETSGKVIEADFSKDTSDKKISLSFSPSCAYPLFVIDYIQSDENKFTANGLLTASNGMLGDINTDDLTISGNATDINVTAVTKNETSVNVEFSFTSDTINPDSINFEGAICLKDGLVVNEWGTPSKILENKIYYISSDNKEVDADSIGQLADMMGSTTTFGEIVGFLQDCKEPISIIGTVNTGVGIVTKLLELTGVIESTNDKLDKINNSISEVHEQIAKLDQRVEQMRISLSQQGDTIISKLDKTNYLLTDSQWKAFVSDYIIPLNNNIDAFQSDYNEYMLSYLDKNSTDEETACIVVYKDINGNITYPGALTGYSIDGIKIESATECRVTGVLEKTKNAVLKNKAKMNKATEKIMKEEIKNMRIVCADGSDSNITGAEFVLALEAEATSSAVEKNGTTKIIKGYINFCDALAGDGSALLGQASSMKPLELFEMKLSFFYNFSEEAKADKESIKKWLMAYLIKQYAFVCIVEKYNSTAVDNEINDKYNAAKEYIDSRFIDTEATKNICYVTDTEIKLSEICISENYSGGGYRHDILYKNHSIIREKTATDSQVLQIYYRYKYLNKIGIAKEKDFYHYLIQHGILTVEDTAATANGLIVFEKVETKNIPLNNTVTLYVKYTNDKSYFKMGEAVKIGSNGKAKSEYYEKKWTKMTSATVFDLSDEETKPDVMLAGQASYDEDHFYWAFKLKGSVLALMSYWNPNHLYYVVTG